MIRDVSPRLFALWDYLFFSAPDILTQQAILRTRKPLNPSVFQSLPVEGPMIREWEFSPSCSHKQWVECHVAKWLVFKPASFFCHCKARKSGWLVPTCISVHNFHTKVWLQTFILCELWQFRCFWTPWGVWSREIGETICWHETSFCCIVCTKVICCFEVCQSTDFHFSKSTSFSQSTVVSFKNWKVKVFILNIITSTMLNCKN